MKTKICKKCGVEKELESFSKCDKNKDGYMGHVKIVSQKNQMKDIIILGMVFI